MAIDFPGSPSTGQRHSHNNTTWEWDGSSWNRITIDLSTTDATTVVGLAVTQFARRDDDNIITGVTTFIGNGYTGVGNTVLIVEGDARVTGVLSVGQGSVSINERDIYAVGVVTGANFKTGTTNVHDVGVELAGVNVLGADTPIGTGATVYNSGLIVSKAGAEYQGVVTASSFVGDIIGDITSTSGVSTAKVVSGGINLHNFGTSGHTFIRCKSEGNVDTNIIRITTSNNDSNANASYGFNIKYKGSGTGNNNHLSFYGDNQTGTEVEALRIYQNGIVHSTSTAGLWAGQYLKMYGDGTNSYLEESGSGNLFIKSNDLVFNNAAGTQFHARFHNGGKSEFAFNGNTKLETTSGGAKVTGDLDVTGNIDVADNVKIKLGTSDDMSIFHDGSNSFIDETGTGNLYISAASDVFIRSYSTNKTMFRGTAGGASSLYYDNAKKFETTSSGATLTGNLTATGNVTAVDATFSGNVSIGKTLTYEDVKNIDSVGVVTARQGIDVTGGTFKADGYVGAAGSVLGSTGSGVNWISPLTGPQGAQGAQGYQGVQGAQGHQGVQGAQGHQGVQGAQGRQGAAGVAGAQGAQGATGSSGGTGAQGHQGVQGAQGATGATGSTSYNAGTLDSLDSTQFLRSDANDTMTGVLTINTSSVYGLTFGGSNDGKIVLNGTNPYIRFQEGGTNKAYLQWHSSGYVQLYNQESGEFLKIGSGADGLTYTDGGSEKTVFHSGNLSTFGSNQITLTTSTNYPLKINSSAEGKIVLQGSSNPYIRFREGTTDKAYIQWSNAGHLQFVNQESGEYLRVSNGVNGLTFTVDGTSRTVYHAGNLAPMVTNGSNTVDGDILLAAGHHFQRSDHHSGHLEGSYNNVGNNAHKSNPIYTIGSNYNPTDAALSNMYGIGYCRTDASFISFTGEATTSWGMYVAAGGTARIFLDGQSGRINATSHLYCDRVYCDLQTTRYLSDVSGNYGSIQINGGGTGNWQGFSIQGRAVFMHDGGTATGIYNDVDNHWLFYAVHGGDSQMRCNNSTRVTAHSSGATVSGNLTVNGTCDLNGNINVGSGTASYITMEDSDNGSRQIHCNSNYIGFLNSSGSWAVRCNDAGDLDIVTRTTTKELKVAEGNNGLLISSNGQYMTHSIGRNADHNEGIFWHTSSNYGIYRTSGNWSGDYQQLRLDWPTGIILNGGSSYGKSGVLFQCHARPITNNAYNLGSSSYRWANLYVNDLQLSNEAKKDEGGNDVDGTWGDWTLQEGEEDIYMINNRTGKKYAMMLKEVE